MVKWVPDKTGRFQKRPHFDAGEIDRECETLTEAFLLRKYGKIEYPLATDDLATMIEDHVDYLDQYADLSKEGRDVEGVTRFFVGATPSIEVSESLTNAENQTNRLRTTLSHELGHVRLHDPVIQAAFGSGDLFEQKEHRVVLKRDEAERAANPSDWMEWQAKYASGAYLMPRKAVFERMKPVWEADGKMPPVQLVGNWTAQRMIQLMVTSFQVSREAATVRLLLLGLITRENRAATLFD